MHDHQAGASVIQDDPQPYVREVWHFQKADINLIRRAMNDFNWLFSILISMRWYLFLIQLLRT